MRVETALSVGPYGEVGRARVGGTARVRPRGEAAEDEALAPLGGRGVSDGFATMEAIGLLAIGGNTGGRMVGGVWGRVDADGAPMSGDDAGIDEPYAPQGASPMPQELPSRTFSSVSRRWSGVAAEQRPRGRSSWQARARAPRCSCGFPWSGGFSP